jgi:hypothetical protein
VGYEENLHHKGKSVTIHYWKKVEDTIWQRLVENCDYATFYHTPAWHYLVQQSTAGSQVKTMGGQLENGTQFVLPMITTRQIGPFYGLVSSAENVYGGIIADGPITVNERQQIYKDIINKWQVISFNFVPPAAKQFNLELDHFIPSSDKTYIISLSQDIEEIYKNYSRGHKSAIKKATKAGVVVEVTEDIADYRAYHDVYLDSVDRWGDSVMGDFTSWAMFEKIYELAQEMPDKIKLWIGRLDGQVISGALIFYWNKSVVYYHGANHREFFSHRAANLIQHEIIKHAAQAEFAYETYDFGPSGVSDGVREFKRRFGGEEQPLNWWFYTHPLSAALQNIRTRLSS